MENEEMNTLVSNEAEKPSEFVYSIGEEAKDSSGEAVDSSKFTFVQQDKSIHDVKFNTKPTTFMKDAMKRFTKNHSSVAGGIILGVLFLLALILPASISFDVDQSHNYETNLPMKLFPAGTGFWDGTRVGKNENYPYVVDEDGEDVLDEDGNKIFNNYANYPDESVVVKVENKTASYMDHAESGANGGYIRLTADPSSSKTSTIGASMYGTSYNGYDFTNNKYTLTYSLGTDDDKKYGDYIAPKYSLIMSSDSQVYFINGGMSENYGEKETISSGANITPHKNITVDLKTAIENSYTLNMTTYEFKKATVTASSFNGKNLSFGLAFMNDLEKSTAIFVQNYRIEGKKNDDSALPVAQRRALNARSFGSSDTFSSNDATIKDANTLVQQEKSSDGIDNPSYWTATTKARYDAFDTFVVKADITYDMYKIAYGLKNNMDANQSTVLKWKKAGLVTWETSSDDDYDMLDDLLKKPSSYALTEEGEKSSEVYLVKITSMTKNDTDPARPIYNIQGQFMMYKYLGYSSIPLHLFGTEKKGRDMLKYVFAGLRTSLILGIVVSFINILIGIIWGSISGYYGGMVDITMERITDILGGVPYIVLMTVLTIKMGTTFFVFALSLCLTGWIGTASTTRSQFYRYRGREYVLAAKTLGAKAPRLIFRHILPNAVGTIVTRSILMIPSVIFSEATIAYLGLGLTNLSSLGVILNDCQSQLSQYPYQLVFPSVIISLLMICFNLFGNGLRDAFNPSLKGED